METHFPFPEGEFNLIYADPPWRYEGFKSRGRILENHYQTMEVEEICALDVPSGRDCTLFLWAISPQLKAAMEVVDAWGFTYKTSAIWDKKVIGMGYYFRLQHEFLLVATKGSPGIPEPAQRVSSVLSCKRGAHSRKPDHFYGILENMYPNAKKLELFARQARPGWEAWGNEIEGCQKAFNYNF